MQNWVWTQMRVDINSPVTGGKGQRGSPCGPWTPTAATTKCIFPKQDCPLVAGCSEGQDPFTGNQVNVPKPFKQYIWVLNTRNYRKSTHYMHILKNIWLKWLDSSHPFGVSLLTFSHLRTKPAHLDTETRKTHSCIEAAPLEEFADQNLNYTWACKHPSGAINPTNGSHYSPRCDSEWAQFWCLRRNQENPVISQNVFSK